MIIRLFDFPPWLQLGCSEMAHLGSLTKFMSDIELRLEAGGRQNISKRKRRDRHIVLSSLRHSDQTNCIGQVQLTDMVQVWHESV